MSSLSRRSLRQKNILRRCLEKAAQDEIDEFVQTNGRDAIDRIAAEMAEFENEQIYDDLYLFDQDYGTDEYDLNYDDYYDDSYYDDIYHDDWSLDDDRDFSIQYSSFSHLQVGTYYKDANNRTFLCCMIDYQKRLINVHTGLEAEVVVELKKVG